MLTDEQKAQRRGKITSSIAAAALGLNPRCTPVQAWLDVRGEREDEEPMDMKAIERGNRLEAEVLRFPVDLPEFSRLEVHPAPFRSIDEWAGDSTDALYCSVDGKALTPEYIGEGKTAGLMAARGYGEEGADDVPESTLVQSHWHLIHWPEVEECLVPVLTGGYRFEFRLYRVKRDQEFEGMLIEDLHRWWMDYVKGGKMPPAEAGDVEFMTRRYPVAGDKVLADTPAIRELASQYAFNQRVLKDAETDKRKASALLRQHFKEHESCRAEWGSVTWRNNKAKTKVDWEAMARELGAEEEDIMKHTITTPGPRVLRVNYRGENDE